MLLSEILPKVTRMHPSNYAMKHKTKTLTYYQLLQQVNKVAQGLSKLSIKPGDRLALLGHPSPDLAIAECAAVAIGAIPVAINPSLAIKEIKQILQDAAPIAVVYDSDHMDIFKCTSSLNIIHTIPCKTAGTSPSIDNYISSLSPLTEWHEADPDDIALVIYTGGTTGRPKGVMHSHRSISYWSFMHANKGGGHNPSKKSIVPNQAHLTGQFILWTTLFEGGCLIYPESYPLQAEEVVNLIEREQIKFLGTVGLLFRDIVNLENIKSRRIQCVEGISCGGSPINEKTFHKAREIFPNAQLTEVYAQTESGQFISSLSVSRCFIEGKLNRLLSVGNPYNMVQWGQLPFEVRIVNDSGDDIEQGDIGEIICKGKQMMLGYWNNPEETDKAIRNGWLYTGDLGKYDEDGYLYLLDRKKDMIIVNGSNVYCAEVEEVLSKHPSILDVAVVGVPLLDEGEEVIAVITLNEETILTLEELKQFCRQEIAEYKIPTHLEIVETLACTAVGKLNKAAIRNQLRLRKTLAN
ncbi:class I adenylate-forming enzyme family protein [Paenibacillus sp. LHD-38]|uniref:class I adenylate-forming enzyme family protein n=1 Tax=Paenibacillus sp. LHD-38 TaxID=3072143 RepID=UPI0028100BE3|nr:class I adenylate-forming enzyme family protein [Paenibacillus sp. LHD-38]MDQ8736220.1 class I adenylate-forming enzyme family protein [Paenibacillus sp. LHD-38]